MDDEDVPKEYWRHDKPYLLPYEAPIPLRIHKVGPTAEGMGFSETPSAVQTFDGVFPTQTTFNGGGRRVPLSWRPGDQNNRVNKDDSSN